MAEIGQTTITKRTGPDTHHTIIPQEPYGEIRNLPPTLGRGNSAKRSPLLYQRSFMGWEILPHTLHRTSATQAHPSTFPDRHDELR